jgi:hypothetical protein
MMVNAILEIGIGWFLTYKTVSIIGAKGNFAMVIKIIGVLLMIGGVISLVHSTQRF